MNAAENTKENMLNRKKQKRKRAGRRPSFFILLFLSAAAFFAFSVDARAGEPRKELTILIYMAGTDLESRYEAATNDIKEMVAADLDEKNVNVAILAGGAKDWHTEGLKSDRKNYIEVKQDEIRIKKQERLTNMGDPQTLIDFLRFGVNEYPADQYGLIFWDHGGGALEGVCLDEWYEDCLTLDEISAALYEGLEGKTLSFVGFDACLMATLETAAAISPYTSCMIASEELEPGSGWDYTFLSDLNSSGNRRSRVMAQNIADRYYRFYPEKEKRTLSVLDLTVMEEVSAELETYFRAVTEKLSEDETVGEAARLRSALFEFGYLGEFYSSSNMVDLQQMLAGMSGFLETDAAPAMEAISKLVIQNRSNIPEAKGVSIFYPYRGKKRIPVLLERYGKLELFPEYAGFLYAFNSRIDEKAALKMEERLSRLDPVSMEIVADPSLMRQIESTCRIMWKKSELGGGRYLRIGSAGEITADETGALLPEFDGRWFTWQGHPLPIEIYDGRDESCSFRAMVNGVGMRIRMESRENGYPVKALKMAGAVPEAGGDMAPKVSLPIRQGDLIQIIYETNVFGEAGTDLEALADDDGALYYSDAFTVETLDADYGDLDPGEYLYGYAFFDYAQNLYLSDFVGVTLEEEEN